MCNFKYKVKRQMSCSGGPTQSMTVAPSPTKASGLLSELTMHFNNFKMMTLNKILKPLLNFLFSLDTKGSMPHFDRVNESLCSDWFYLHRICRNTVHIELSFLGLFHSISLDCVHYHPVLLEFSWKYWLLYIVYLPVYCVNPDTFQLLYLLLSFFSAWEIVNITTF